MSISGKEETGAFAWQSSNYSAGMPIKKRKFPLVRSPSPPPEESPCLSPVEAKNSSPSHELTSLNAGIRSCSLGISIASNNPNFDNKGEITADTQINLAGVNTNLSKCISHVPSLAIDSDSLDTKEKLFISAQQNMIGGSKLDSAQTEVLAEHGRKVVLDLLQAGRDCPPGPFRMPGNIELSLGPEEPLVPVSTANHSSADHSSNGSSQFPDKLNPSTLRLSLSQKDCVIGCQVGDSMVNNGSTYVHGKRSNWDLNTSMDAWEGPVDDCGSLETVKVSGSQKPGRTHDVEPLISAVPKFVSDAGQLFHEVTNRISESPESSPSPLCICRAEDSLQLSLSTLAPTLVTGKQSNVSAQVNSCIVLPKSELIEGLVSTRNTSSAGCDTVNPEPFNENAEQCSVSARGNSMGLSDVVTRQLVPKPSTEDDNSSIVSLENITESRSIQSEPVQEGKEKQIISHTSVEKIVLCQDKVSLSLAMSLQPKKSYPLGLFTCSELSMSVDVPNQSENATHVDEAHEDKDKSQGSCKMFEQAATGTMLSLLGHDSKESNSFDGIHTSSTEDANVDNHQLCKLEANDVFSSTSKNSDGSESDEENKNILADILEDVYGSEGNDDTLVNSEGRDDGKEDEYEDGEVREALMHIEADAPTKDREEEKIICDAFDCKISEVRDMCVDCSNALPPDISDIKVKVHVKINDDHMEGSADAVLEKLTDKATDRDCSLQELSTADGTADRDAEKRPIKTGGRSPPVLSEGTNDQKGHDVVELSDGATDGGKDIGTTVDQIADVNIKGTNTLENFDSTLPNTESYLSHKNAGKDTNNGDANSGGSRSRIINLPQASNVTSPCNPRLMFNRPLSATERDRHTDFEGESVPLGRNRSEFYADVPQNINTDRFLDRSFRKSGTNFMRGRGRGFRQHVEWDSDRNFGAEINYNPGSYRFSRYRYASAGGDAEFEGNDYGMARSRTSGMGRRGNSSRHPSSGRLSPGARDATGTRGTQMLRRFPGNANSSRSTGEHYSDYVELSNGREFMRGLSKDVIDPTNEGLDGQFVGGSRNFSTVQRRGLPRIRSKSPLRSRTRSQELNHRRSPTTYRMDRKRSPDHPCFTEEVMGRRCVSPPYVARPSRDLRNTESGPVNPYRMRPFDRVLPESTRRFDITDARQRRDADEFFKRPNRSGRFNEFGGQRRGDDRRKCGEKRGLGGSFRPSFNGADRDNFQFHEDGNYPEADTKRGDVREREFDRRINYKTGIAPSRMRNLEEDSGNYRRGGQVSHDDGFDDLPQMKRRKF